MALTSLAVRFGDSTVVEELRKQIRQRYARCLKIPVMLLFVFLSPPLPKCHPGSTPKIYIKGGACIVIKL